MSKSQSNSKESLKVKKTALDLSPRRSSMPTVVISPTELLLNQSLQNKLAQNECNRQGFYLTDTDASVMSGGSSEFLAMSCDERSDSEIMLLTSDDLKLNRENCSSTISSSDLFSTDIDDDDDTDVDDDYDEVADCGGRREMTPVRQDIEDVIRMDLANQISTAGALNDLSDPNRSPALNITMDEYGCPDPEVTTPQNSVPLMPMGIPIQQLSSHQDWDKKTNSDKIYNSPDDNFQEPKTPEKELYYDSSDLNLEASSSSEDIEKELNTVEQDDVIATVEQKNNTVDQNMSTSFQEKALSTEQKDVEIKLSDTPDPAPRNIDENFLDPGISRSEDVLSPLMSETADPLGMLSYPQLPLGLFPDEAYLEENCDPGSVTLPSNFPDDPIYFTRNQRSIRPSKRKSLLIRSSSLDKKYLTQKSSELHSDSLDSFDGDDMYIVEAITPCSPGSISDREFLNPTTPGQSLYLLSYLNNFLHINDCNFILMTIILMTTVINIYTLITTSIYYFTELQFPRLPLSLQHRDHDNKRQHVGVPRC